MPDDNIPFTFSTTGSYDNVDWHSYVRFLVAMLFIVGGFIVAMLYKTFSEWFLRDLTGIQIWLSDEELNRRLNLQELVEHNTFGSHGHPKFNELGTIYDYSKKHSFDNDVVETYDDVSINVFDDRERYINDEGPRTNIHRHNPHCENNKPKWKNSFIKKRSLLNRSRGSLLDFLTALSWTGIIVISWISAFFTLNVKIESLVAGVGFASFLALSHTSDIFKGFINYLMILGTGTFERGDIVEISASVGSFGGSVTGVVVEVIPGSLVLYCNKPYRALNVHSVKIEAEKYLKEFQPKENYKIGGDDHRRKLMVKKWINEERYHVYISLGTVFDLPVTYHTGWKTVQQRAILNI